MQDNLQIPYGIFDFKRIRTEGYYYIDKTGYIPTLEQAGSFLFFVRPRRFGKSLFINMLRCYYDLAEKENFEKLFGGLAIAENPTRNVNRFQVLYMDFSEVNRGGGTTLRSGSKTTWVTAWMLSCVATRPCMTLNSANHSTWPTSPASSRRSPSTRRRKIFTFT